VVDRRCSWRGVATSRATAQGADRACAVCPGTALIRWPRRPEAARSRTRVSGRRAPSAESPGTALIPCLVRPVAAHSRTPARVIRTWQPPSSRCARCRAEAAALQAGGGVLLGVVSGAPSGRTCAGTWRGSPPPRCRHCRRHGHIRALSGLGGGTATGRGHPRSTPVHRVRLLLVRPRRRPHRYQLGPTRPPSQAHPSSQRGLDHGER
jgi:hypothetical protein